jgi:catecholate siderophore receptor
MFFSSRDPGGQMEIEGYLHNTPRRNVFNQTDLVYRFDMTPDIKHTLLAGAEVGNQRSSSERNLSCFGTPDTNFVVACDGSATAVDAPFLNPALYLPMTYGDPRERRYTNLDVASGYVQDQIAVTKYIDLLAGVRFDHFDLTFRGADFPLPPGADPAGQAAEQAEGEIVDPINQTIRSVTNKWSPRLGVVGKPTEDLSVYFAYSRSFLPASSDQFVVLTPSLAALQPQGFSNLEVGVKYQIRPRLLLTSALYQLDRGDSEEGARL